MTLAEFNQQQRAEQRQAEQAALDACPIKVGMTVTRQGFNALNPSIQGRVIGRVAVQSVRLGQYVVDVKCRVAWDGATNGARRIGGNQEWNLTTTVKADRLTLV